MPQAPALLVAMALFVTACGTAHVSNSEPGPPAPTPAPPSGGGGGGGGGTALNCQSAGTTQSGTTYQPRSFIPNCYQQFLARVDDARTASQIPSGSRGRTIIVDEFVDIDGEPATALNLRNLFPTLSWVTTSLSAFPFAVSQAAHGWRVNQSWELASIEGLAPQAFVQVVPSTRLMGGVPTPTGSFFIDPSDTLAAWQAGVEANPLFDDTTQLANTTAIVNISATGGFRSYLELAFTASRSNVQARGQSFDFILTVAAQNGDRAQSPDFRVLPTVHSSALPTSVANSLSETSGHLRIVPRAGSTIRELAIHREVDDFISALDTMTLEQIARSPSVTTQDPQSWQQFIDASSASSLVVEALNELNSLSIEFPNLTNGRLTNTTVLAGLAELALAARGDRFLVVSHLNPAGNGPEWGNACTVTRDSCIFVSYLANGTSFAAPRVAAAIDHLWLLWPSLSRRSVLDLLFGCTSDIGASGVDGVYGQGLLDFGGTGGECVFSPNGALRDPTSGSVTAGALSLSGTSESAYRPIDSFGRDFSYTVVSPNAVRASWEKASVSGELLSASRMTLHAGAGEGFGSTWLQFALGSIQVQLEMRYEPDGLLGALGSGSFQLSDGLSLASSFSWNRQLSDSWRFSAEIGHAIGSAQGAQGSIIQDISLELSQVKVTFDWQVPDAMWGIQAYASCNTGQTGQAFLPSAAIAIQGLSSCSSNARVSRRF